MPATLNLKPVFQIEQNFSNGSSTQLNTALHLTCPQVQAYQLAPSARQSMDSYIEYVPTESHPIQLRPSMDSVAGSYVSAAPTGGQAPRPSMGSHPVRFSTGEGRH